MHIFKLLILLALFYSCSSGVSGKFFTCTSHFKESKKTAVDLVKFMDNYIKQEELKIQVLKRVSSSIKEQLTEELEGTKPIPPNPVSMYLYAKTVSDALYSIGEISNRTEDNSQFKVMLSKFSSGLPVEADVVGVAESFIRLQNTYNVTAKDMSSGNILGFKVKPLSAIDCYDIGEVIFEKGHTRLASQWFHEALDKAQEYNTTKNITEFILYVNEMLEEIKQREIQDTIEGRMVIYGTALLQKPNGQTGIQNYNRPEVMELIEVMKKNNSKVYYGAETDRNFKYTKNYETFCAKRDVFKTGFCKYSKIQDLGFFGRPIKIEYINNSPTKVLIVHDLLDQSLVDHLHGYSANLTRSNVVVPDAESLEEAKKPSDARTSSTFHYKNDESNDMVRKLYRVLERLTGLRMNYGQADSLQIVNYGIGGEYKPHFDWLEEDQINWMFHTGTNRLLTIILYLSDVEVGGSTVFPDLGIAIAPEKGSALFFTNLDSNGRGDLFALHGGCPVFFGSKWIANKWVHVKNQDMNFLQTVPSVWS